MLAANSFAAGVVGAWIAVIACVGITGNTGSSGTGVINCTGIVIVTRTGVVFI